ncbi:hypothetical protein M0N77_02130 [Psychrobacter sp. AH5]|uniref:hypothetical protein n=1 Tax=Psychrobacter sp. AH5 TaxID=2937433 RepID=UPI003341AFD6
MSVITITVPSRKRVFTVFIMVIGLHVLTAIVLRSVESPTAITKPLIQTTPIDIELITLANQSEATVAKGGEAAKSAEAPESSFESVPKTKTPEVIASNSKVVEKETAAEVIDNEVVEEVIVNPETSTTETINSKTVEPTGVMSKTTEPADESATELELLSGTTATIKTTIKESANGTDNASQGLDEEALNGRGLAKKGASKDEGKSPIAGGYAPFSMAPQSPMAGNIITNNNTSNKSTSYHKSITGIKNKQGTNQGDNSRALISIIPALPFEHELIDSSYAITADDWLIAPRFMVADLAQYLLDSGFNNNGNNRINDNKSEKERVSIYFSLSVDAQGRIKEISTIISSGNEKLDEAIKGDLLKARLKRYDKNGKSLAGIATLTLAIDSP